MCIQIRKYILNVFLLNRWMETCPCVPRSAGAADQGGQQEMIDMAETGHEAKVPGLIHSIWLGGVVKPSSTVHAHLRSPPDFLVPTPPCILASRTVSARGLQGSVGPGPPHSGKPPPWNSGVPRGNSPSSLSGRCH